MNEVAQRVKDRLSELIAYLGLNNSAFEKKCGLSNGYIRNFKGNLGGKKLEDILNAFPQLNKDWLLFGKGSMLINSENQPEDSMAEQPEPDTSLVEYLKRKVAELEGKVEKLTDEKADLLQQNAVLKYENQLLTPQKGRNAEDAESSLSASAAQ